METTFDSIALHVPTILLPGPDVDQAGWAVIACDQYTSQPEFWQQVADAVAGKPSTLNMILPEVYLGQDTAVRVAVINRAMQEYLDTGVLVSQEPGFVLVDRQTPHAASRKGLVVALDLERYDYRDGSQSLIRATEGTILDRLPPRVEVRKDAPIELPHIMVLIDDPEKTVIEPLFAAAVEPAYDITLMLQAGRLRGYPIGAPGQIAAVTQALERLAASKRFQNRYGVSDKGVLLYAVGDGNHSLATAKVIWETIKQQAETPGAVMQHPARYALVELVNLHDPGLSFEPIHRVVFGAQADALLGALQRYTKQYGARVRTRSASRDEAVAVAAQTGSAALHRFAWVASEGFGIVEVEHPRHVIATGTLQAFLDDYLQEHPQASIDYIHGDGVVTELGSRPDNIGFFLPALPKEEFFRTIILDGTLPRKTFSMGEADEKRFYMECRKIK